MDYSKLYATKLVVDAARAIIHQRDYYAEHQRFDATVPNPDAEPVTQCFDDWAADILDTALCYFDAHGPNLDDC